MLRILIGVIIGILIALYFQEDITNIFNNIDKILEYLLDDN
tara:strand:+ start:2102 stop:2224 length:123 start_codon:yes stop_codon:yes gene_type:complete